MARPSCAAGAQNLVEHRGPRARPVSPIPGSPTSSAARASPPPLPGSPGEGVRRVDPGALRATICNYRLTSKRNVQSLATNVWLDTAPIGVAGQGPLTCPLATFAVAICNGSSTSTPADKSLGVQVERERSKRLSLVRQVQADARTAANAFLLVANERWPPHAVRVRVLDRFGRTLSISSPQRTNETPV